MSTTNPVYGVLATSGNQAPLTAGNPVSSLANGQIGVFNYHTGLSVDGTVPGNARDIFIAVGINRTLGGTNPMEDLSKSAGQMIQTSRAKALTIKGYVAEIPKVVVITGFDAKCNTDYALKLEVRSQQNYQTNGYNQITKTYSYRTVNCTQINCTECTQGDGIELAKGLVDVINADAEAVFIASLFGNLLSATIGDPTVDGTAIIGVGTETFNVALLAADTPTQAAAKIAAAINAVSTSAYVASSSGATLKAAPKKSIAVPTALITLNSSGGTGVTVTGATNINTAITDTVAYKAAYPGSIPSIRITSNPEVRVSGGAINVLYHKSGMDFIVSAIDGFTYDTNVKITTTTELQVAEGKGYDIKQLEYVAKGWEIPGPYRTKAVTGLPSSAEYFVSEGINYNLISIAYDQFSVGGWLEYLNNLETIIAIPCADTTTLTGLVTIIDPIFTQFRPMANDVAAMNCTNTNISTINDFEKDGIESLA